MWEWGWTVGKRHEGSSAQVKQMMTMMMMAETDPTRLYLGQTAQW